MAGTHTRIVLHVVFSTKDRAPVITPDLQPRLYDYMGGILRAEGATLFAIGGMPDHIHVLLRMRTDAALADLMRTLKGRSSHWVHETFPEHAAFGWQDGYSAFSVSRSQEAVVKQYIERQEEHHRVRTFRVELIEFLDAHGVEYDPRYIAP